MRFITTSDYKGMSLRAANIITAQATLKPDSLFGFATGSSPLGIYENLIKKYNQLDVTFSKASAVNLDEYVGLSADDPQSYHYFMKTNLFSKVDLGYDRWFIPNGLETDDKKVCGAMDTFIKEHGGIDLQLLGIGQNGHIGFNEPAPVFEKDNRRVSLTENTIAANARFFASADDVPREAYTMGLGAIMSAKKILVIANGKQKAEIIKKAFLGPVTPMVPASILQFHPDVTLIADKEAMSACPLYMQAFHKTEEDF